MISGNNIKPENGVWYVTTKCEECRTIVPVMTDPSGGKNTDAFPESSEDIELTCPSCMSMVIATPENVSTFRWNE